MKHITDTHTHPDVLHEYLLFGNSSSIDAFTTVYYDHVRAANSPALLMSTPVPGTSAANCTRARTLPPYKGLSWHWGPVTPSQCPSTRTVKLVPVMGLDVE